MIESIQHNILKNYFAYLQLFGYLSPDRVRQIVFSVLLLDCIPFFAELYTGDFVQDINKIMKRLNCCNCLIPYDNFYDIPKHSFYVYDKK